MLLSVKESMVDEDADVSEVAAPEFDANDQKSYAGVQKMVECKFSVLKQKHGDNCNVCLLFVGCVGVITGAKDAVLPVTYHCHCCSNCNSVSTCNYLMHQISLFNI